MSVEIQDKISELLIDEKDYDFTKPQKIPKNDYPTRIPKAMAFEGEHPYLGDNSDIFKWGRVPNGIPFVPPKNRMSKIWENVITS